MPCTTFAPLLNLMGEQDGHRNNSLPPFTCRLVTCEQTTPGGWRGRKKKYGLCRLRLWDSCRCILSTARREYNRKRNHCCLRKRCGAGDAPAAGSQHRAGPHRCPASLPALRGLPASGASSCWGPTAHPDTSFWGWHFGCWCSRPAMALRTSKGMHSTIPSLRKHLQGHQIFPKISSVPLCLPARSTPLLPLPFCSLRQHVPFYGSFLCLTLPNTQLGAGFGH